MNRNEKTIAALFRNIFCECIEGKSCICLLSAMSVGDDQMINLMIIYIQKAIAKALDINDIMKKIYGDINSMSSHLSINNQNMNTY